MDFEEFERKKPISLQLAPMIDIFTLIIVFLLKGTVLGGVSIVIPTDMQTAKSFSKESVEAAPQIFVQQDQVLVPTLNKSYSITSFKNPTANFESEFIDSVKSYMSSLKFEAKESVVHVNLIADARVNYGSIFPIIKLVRKSGFESVLFITTGEAKK